MNSVSTRLAFQMSVVLAIASSHAALAGPITLRFDATVASATEVDGGVALPFTPKVGDVFTVTFELEKFDGGTPYEQSGPLLFEFQEFQFVTAGFGVAVNDNREPSDIPPRGAIAAPDSLPPIYEQGPGVVDSFVLSCGSSSTPACDPMRFGEDIALVTDISFIGNSALLSSQDLVTDISIWNSFVFRELRLVFTDTSTNGAAGIGAYMGDVTVVPEVAGIEYVSVLGLGCLAAFRRLRRPVSAAESPRAPCLTGEC